MTFELKTKSKMIISLKKFKSSKRGAVAIEYGLIASLIIVVILGALQSLGNNSSNGFGGAFNKLSNAISAAR